MSLQPPGISSRLAPFATDTRIDVSVDRVHQATVAKEALALYEVRPVQRSSEVALLLVEHENPNDEHLTSKRCSVSAMSDHVIRTVALAKASEPRFAPDVSRLKRFSSADESSVFREIDMWSL